MPGPMTDEHKARMAEGRRLAAERKRLAKLSEGAVEAPYESEPYVLPVAADDEFVPYELSDDEKAEIDREVAERLAKERRAAAKKAYAADAIDRQRRKAGEIPVDEEQKKRNAELVSVFVQMPTLRKPGGGEHLPEPIVIDQKVYTSGRWYHNIPRAQADYMVYLMDQARRHVNAVEGRSTSYFNPGTFQVVHQGGVASGGGGGRSFDALHKRAS